MSSPSQQYVTLNTGARMPAIGTESQVWLFTNFTTNPYPFTGLGCWSGTTEEQIKAGKAWVFGALQMGYRHIDTAHDYRTEGIVGQAVRESGIPRDEIFVTSKLP